MINYLIEVSICLALFYAFFRIALVEVKLLNLNRIYLLATVALALIIPCLGFSSGTANPLIIPVDMLTQEVVIQLQLNSTKGNTSSLSLWQWLYLAGLSIALFRLAFQLFKIRKQIRSNPRERFGRYFLVSIPKSQVSSFLKYVFVPDSFDRTTRASEAIISHELVHLEQGHSLDILFINLMTCLLWFNPCIYWYRKAIKLQHEYIADEIASEKLGKPHYAKELLTQSIQQSGFPLAHSYTQHPVERRLKMIDNLNPTTMKKLRLLWSLPLMFALIFLFGFDHETYSQTVDSESNQKRATLTGNVRDFQAGERLEGVTIFFLRKRNKTLTNGNGQYTGTMTNADGDYGLRPEKSDTLIVFRKKGYESVIVPYKGQDVVNVNLTKKPVPEKKGG